jgi:macrolide transport system ATP-binding/permease protein
MPDWKPEVRRQLTGLRLDAAREAEIVDEVAAHLDEEYEELRANGVSDEDAVRLTLAELSDHELLRREMAPLRQARQPDPITPGAAVPPPLGWTAWLGDLQRDVRYAWRMLARTPGFTAVAVVTLGLGIGVTSAVFSLVNATLLARLPVADVDRLVYVGNGGSGSSTFSYPGYVDLRDRNEVFSSLMAWGWITASLNADNQTGTVDGVIATGNYFETLGVTTALGRPLTPQDDRTPGGHPVVVISHGLWQRRFGGRTDIVGQSMLMNGHAFTIVGVTSPEFGGPAVGLRQDIFVPMMMQAVMRPPRAGYSGERNPDLLRNRGNSWLFAIGRLKPGATREQAQASLSALQMNLDPPERRPSDLNRRISLEPVASGLPGQRAQMVSVATLLSAVVAGVLLIACANVANLLLSRAVARRREIAVRLAIGAGRWRLVRQLLTESVLLALAGGVLGVLIAYAIVEAFGAWPPPAGALPLTLEFSLDTRVLFFALAISCVTGLAFGLAPALRTARPELVPSLKDESFVPDEHARRFNLKNALIVLQVAISLALLIGSGLFLRSLNEAQRIDTGYAVSQLLTLNLPVNLLRYTRTQSREFYRRAIEEAEALPGVEAAAVARVAVLTGGGRTTSLHIEGREGSDTDFTSEGRGTSASANDAVNANVVSPRYFATMGLTMREGRDFGVEDVDESMPTIVVNETFVRRHLTEGRPLGKRVSVNGPRGTWRTIVGVVSDGKYSYINEPPIPIVYVPLSQNHETGVTLYIRTANDPASSAAGLVRAIQALEPNLPLGQAQPMSQVLGVSLYLARMAALFIGVLGILALTLASIGLYGVLAFAVSRRTREIGIRSALGAGTSSLFRLVVFEGMGLVGVGIALGLAMAWASSGVIASFLVGVHPTEPTTYVAVAALLAIVAAVACAVPAWRATQVDPLIALRQQ